MYQQITIIGNLGRDPESGQTKTGKTYTRFSLAASRSLGQGAKETTWFSVTAYDKAGQYIANYAMKGSLVMVTGRLQPDAQGGPRIWVSNSGESRASFEVIANSVQILNGFKGSDQRNQTPQYGNRQQEEAVEQYY